MTNWSKTKFRASSWGNLMTEPKEKAAKDRGELSKSCQKELIKIYNLVKYGRRKDITTKQMTKGIMCEEDSITLFSRVEKKIYIKNEEQLENEWFTGKPDIFSGEHIRAAEEVDDIKTSWELDSFMPKLVDDIDPGYDSQLQVYYDLTGAKIGSLAYCLTSAPKVLIQDELMKLKFKMNIIWDEDPDYLEACAEIIKNMTFEDIDYRERVIKQVVQRDDILIQKMKDKVPRLRSWLSWFEDLHMNGRTADIIHAAPVVLELPPITADQIILTKKTKK